MNLKSNKTLPVVLSMFAFCTFFPRRAKAGAFFPTGEMITPRSGQTATLLTNGMVLIAGGMGNSNGQPTASAELYNPATRQWTATSPMSTPRDSHTATLLPDGKVLVTGGDGTNIVAPYFGALTNAELYDPVSGTWTPTGSMKMARYNHTASLLPNGKVLVAGGAYDLSGSAELYDPATGQWTYTGSMTTNRHDHTATVLTNGMVLVAGGLVSVSVFNSGATATAELYNPATGTWTATGSMTTNRVKHTATLLKNGKVLVVANHDYGAHDASAELYDPVSGTWSATGSLNDWRDEATATLLPDGEVLVAGGNNSALTEIAEIYNPDTGQWLGAGSLATSRFGSTATLMANGQVLIAGGSFGGPSAELFNPNTAWKATGSLSIPRDHSVSTMTVLTNGEVLVAGGVGTGDLESSAELYNPRNGAWTNTGSMNEPRAGHTATLLPNGKVLVAGGNSDSGVASSAELYDPVTGAWTETGSMNTGRRGHIATLLKNGKVLVTGGRDVNNQTLTSSELYNPATGTWSTTASTQYPTTATTLLTDGKVLAIESHGDGYCELYDPSTETWTMTGTAPFYFPQPNVTRLADGKVFAYAESNPYWGPEIYDPASGVWTAAASMTNFSGSTATTLRDGRVLVEGGGTSTAAPDPNAAIYDPTTDTWTNTLGRMTDRRSDPLAVLLLDGRVLVTGSDDDFNPSICTAELFDPSVGTTPAIVLAPSSTFVGGAFQFTFTATAGQSFTVWSTADVSAPFSTWTSLGGVTEVSPGLYQFSDSQATNLVRRFYRVTSP